MVFDFGQSYWLFTFTKVSKNNIIYKVNYQHKLLINNCLTLV